MLPSDTTYDHRTWVGKKNSLEILDQVKLLKLAGQTVSSSDDINIGGSINAKDGDQLFAGMNTVKPVQVGGVWTLPSTVGNIAFALSSVPFDMGKEVAGVVGVGKDTNGNPSTVWMGYGGRKIYVSPLLYTLSNPVVRVSFTDGSVWDYTAADGGKGKKIVVIPLTVNMSGSFKNTVTLKDPPNGFVSVVSIKTTNKVGITPTIEVMSSSMTTIIVNFDISTTDGKRPVRLWYRKSTDSNESWAPAVYDVGQTIKGLPINYDGKAGTTYVVPEFKVGDLTEPSPYGK